MSFQLSRCKSAVQPMRSDRHSYTFLFTAGLLFAIFLTSCIQKERISLNIPEGFATNTLKEFANQAEVEIIFDSQAVYGVKTNAVKGKYDHQSALRIMLKDTPLKVDFDDSSGAYAIFRIKISNNDRDTSFSHSMAAMYRAGRSQ
jgi:hypothetical protein